MVLEYSLGENTKMRERIEFLKSMDKGFRVKKKPKQSSWIPIQKVNEPIENYSERTQLSNELIIELDKKTFDKNNELFKEKIKPILIENNISFDAYTTGSKSIHIHLFFDRSLSNSDRYTWLIDKLGKELIEKESIDDAYFTKDAQLIPIEYQDHHKSGKPKTTIDGNNIGKINSYSVSIKKLKAPKNSNSLSTKKKLNLISLRDLMNLPKQKGYIVEGMILPETLNMIFAPSGHLKSTILLYLAICVVNKKDFLGLKTKKVPVLYLDKENNQHKLRERATGIYKGLKIKKNKPNFVLLLKEGMFDNNNFVELLADHIKQNNIKLVCVDTLIRFTSGEENSAKDMNKIYTAFLKLQEQSEATIIVLHHAGKDKKYRGSSDLKGQVDSLYKIERKNDTSPYFKIINEKNRSGEIQPIPAEIIFGQDTIEFKRNDEQDEAEMKDKRTKWAEAYSFVLNFSKKRLESSTDFWKRKELISEMEAHNFANPTQKIVKTNVDNVLNWMKNNGQLKKGLKYGEYVLEPEKVGLDLDSLESSSQGSDE